MNLSDRFPYFTDSNTQGPDTVRFFFLYGDQSDRTFVPGNAEKPA